MQYLSAAYMKLLNMAFNGKASECMEHKDEIGDILIFVANEHPKSKELDDGGVRLFTGLEIRPLSFPYLYTEADEFNYDRYLIQNPDVGRFIADRKSQDAMELIFKDYVKHGYSNEVSQRFYEAMKPTSIYNLNDFCKEMEIRVNADWEKISEKKLSELEFYTPAIVDILNDYRYDSKTKQEVESLLVIDDDAINADYMITCGLANEHTNFDKRDIDAVKNNMRIRTDEFGQIKLGDIYLNAICDDNVAYSSDSFNQELAICNDTAPIRGEYGTSTLINIRDLNMSLVNSLPHKEHLEFIQWQHTKAETTTIGDAVYNFDKKFNIDKADKENDDFER